VFGFEVGASGPKDRAGSLSRRYAAPILVLVVDGVLLLPLVAVAVIEACVGSVQVAGVDDGVDRTWA